MSTNGEGQPWPPPASSPAVDILSWIGNRIGKPPGWERVVRLFASPEKCRGMRDTRVVRDSLIFIAQPGVLLGWHIALFGTYEPELREVFREVLMAGSVAVDVGANVGWHTLLMARLAGESGRVLASKRIHQYVRGLSSIST